MRNTSIVLFCALFLSTLAQAAGGKVVVTCGNTRFSDLTKIEIQETDLDGQYLIVETLKDRTRLSPVFGMEEIEKSEFPELTSWNGYTRKLVRYGRENYALTIQDECSGGASMIDCKESF